MDILVSNPSLDSVAVVVRLPLGSRIEVTLGDTRRIDVSDACAEIAKQGLVFAEEGSEQITRHSEQVEVGSVQVLGENPRVSIVDMTCAQSLDISFLEFYKMLQAGLAVWLTDGIADDLLSDQNDFTVKDFERP